MGVAKIIQKNPEIFKIDKDKNYTEIEAIRKIAAMECLGNEIQKENFAIRQTYTAICNLISLGYRETGIHQAIEILPKAEWFQQYKIAQDLCDRLITHFYQYGDMESVETYKALFDKYTLIISCEHESKLLYGQAIYNYKHILPIDMDGIMKLLEAIKKQLPVDSMWYHYYYYQCKTLMFEGEELEALYLEAINYFESLYLNHTNYISSFTDQLIKHYLENEHLEKAQLLIQKQSDRFEVGTIRWFRNSQSFVNVLLKQNDPKSFEICARIMDHPKYKELPSDKKKEWEVAYDASVKVKTGAKKN